MERLIIAELLPHIAIAIHPVSKRMRSERSTMNLEEALENIDDREIAVRRAAFTVIEQAGEQALPGLIAILFEDNDYRQEIAISILWKLLREHGFTHPNEAKAVIHAIKANRDNNPLVVLDGIGLLSDLKSLDAFDDLVGFLTDEDEDLRSGAAEALGLIGDERAVSPLLPLLNDPEWEVKVAAVFALGNIGSTKAVPNLITKLDDNESRPVGVIQKDGSSKIGLSVAQVAAEALKRIGTQEALKAVKKWEDIQ